MLDETMATDESQNSSPEVKEEGTEDTSTETEATPEAQGIPYDKYHKRVQEVKELKEELENLKSSGSSEGEIYTDEGKALQGDLKALKEEISSVKQENARKDVLISHPILKEKWDEFEEFREDPENKGMNLKTAAKAFMVENELLGSPEPRKGLEKSTGGDKTAPPSAGMTADEVSNLRKNNWEGYLKKVQNGEIQIKE